MRLTKLYSRIPEQNGILLLDDLSDLYAGAAGNNGETLTLVSYFPKELRIGPELNFITNKYVLFVAGGDMASANHTFGWSLVVKDPNGADVTTQYALSEINTFSQEYAFLLVADDPEMDGYEVTVSCQANLNGQAYALSLTHLLAPVAEEIAALADNDENNAALGNPTCTYFIANHLRDYLGQTGFSNLGYINLSAGLIYQNMLEEFEAIQSLGLFRNSYDALFSESRYTNEINGNGNYDELPVVEIGPASIKLPLLWMYLDPDNNFQRNSDLEALLHQGFDGNESVYIDLYHLSVFPKSAIKYSVEVIKMFFDRFKSECNPSGNVYIYNTFKTGSERDTMLDTWRNLEQEHLHSHNQLLINIITEYFNGPKHFIDTELLTEYFWRNTFFILRHDWSPYLTRLLDWWPITLPQLRIIFPQANEDLLIEFQGYFNRYYKVFFLNTIRRRAHFFAQIREEVGLAISATAESLNYTPQALINTFTYFANHPAEATQYGRVGSSPYTGPGEHPADQVAIANRAYANRIGNGDIASGDGWNFRGKGYIQLTGRANYNTVQAEINNRTPNSGIDILVNPDDILTTKGGLISAMAYWSMNNLNQLADNGTTGAHVDAITAVVNFYTTTYQDRRDHFTVTLGVFSN